MFSDSFKDNPEVMLLLVLIFSLMGLLFYYLRKKGKKRYQFDERYEKITNRFKAKAWDIMWVVWLVSWMVVIMFDGIHFSFF
ncbi:hypothetical protein P5G51_013425 [Virgibacillus sp. 179-BFC.A HS]|uniref:Uncharacterized protein n=1 Tax=Tigheibacillus jepli TaxID=3035914 RepID=A0ABU5CIT1_9BACI|nr:hypothetical protein [Virgibacillus sp. 179-BFC.A HS]MDY0406258.1 hypothetical protein [Virgibacillus sp. 179-BFC.A HS]